jgi:hypothetical protein
VILDATASRSLLSAVKAGPVSVTDVAVQDAPGVTRTWVLSEGLSRTAFKAGRGGGVLRTVVDDLLACGVNGAKAKAVVFVYKDILNHEELKRLGPSVSLAYFGNVRGYNNHTTKAIPTFVTVGDPVSNIGMLDSVAAFERGRGHRAAEGAAASQLRPRPCP